MSECGYKYIYFLGYTYSLSLNLLVAHENTPQREKEKPPENEKLKYLN